MDVPTQRPRKDMKTNYIPPPKKNAKTNGFGHQKKAQKPKKDTGAEAVSPEGPDATLPKCSAADPAA